MSFKSRKKKGSFDDLSVHRMMMEDRTRTLSYKTAIERAVKKSDVVLDIGCGTGILSFFAARKGCAKVYAVEKSRIVEQAKKTAALSGLGKKITFVRTDIKKFKPREKIDLLIQEQIGNFVWNEDMIAKVRLVADRYLSRRGKMIPYRIDLYATPVDYKTGLHGELAFWSKRPYGFDFSNMVKQTFLQNIEKSALPHIVRLRDNASFLSREKLVHSIDLEKETQIPRKIGMVFKIRRKALLTGVCMFFRIRLDEHISFSTRPGKPGTCWGQIFLPAFRSLPVSKGALVEFTLFPKKDHRRWKFFIERKPTAGRVAARP